MYMRGCGLRSKPSELGRATVDGDRRLVAVAVGFIAPPIGWALREGVARLGAGRHHRGWHIGGARVAAARTVTKTGETGETAKLNMNIRKAGGNHHRRRGY